MQTTIIEDDKNEQKLLRMSIIRKMQSNVDEANKHNAAAYGCIILASGISFALATLFPGEWFTWVACVIALCWVVAEAREIIGRNQIIRRLRNIEKVAIHATEEC
jgi:hypothetical protein